MPKGPLFCPSLSFGEEKHVVVPKGQRGTKKAGWDAFQPFGHILLAPLGPSDSHVVGCLSEKEVGIYSRRRDETVMSLGAGN